MLNTYLTIPKEVKIIRVNGTKKIKKSIENYNKIPLENYDYYSFGFSKVKNEEKKNFSLCLTYKKRLLKTPMVFIYFANEEDFNKVKEMFLIKNS